MSSHFILTDAITGLLCAHFMFKCYYDYRYNATATLDTVGVSPPMADPSAAQQ